MPVDVTMGSSPLIITIPHASTQIAHSIMQRLNDIGRALTDTHWHIDRLHHDLVEDVTVVKPNFHRYLCDLDCNPSAWDDKGRGPNLTPSAPILNQDGQAIWRYAPDKLEMASWRSAFYAPYHAALATQIARVRSKHGFAVLYDCRATRSEIPNLFDGVAPNFSIGTYMGATCDHKLAACIAGICLNENNYTSDINKHLKGGWIVRRYGCPKRGVHALQMELSLSTYLQAERDPWLYDPVKAQVARIVLAKILNRLKSWIPD
ncbi:N-formylglutamate amidohydrolase [uncultured Roseobacter sp.]|uniref:N-formylglutamate amidohydrolase n=1 Tax=uncultured Roseobacter sp. TaxID=114847 RepID=UPI00262A2804|nr:N-formylglutamate amidohydrolase [uncultured Roseobacter sp.]